MKARRSGPLLFVSFNTDITGFQNVRGQQRAAGHRAAEKARLRRRGGGGGGEEERQPRLKGAVELNHRVYVLKEQSVPLAEEHSSVRFPLLCFLPESFVFVCVDSVKAASFCQ